jgi:hypothetical protein
MEEGAQGAPPVTEENEEYFNDLFGVSAKYDAAWSVREDSAIDERYQASPAADGTSDTGGEKVRGSPAQSEGINVAGAPSTTFTDGKTITTLYYILLSQKPKSLLSYLQSRFPSRAFESFSNGIISGFVYDVPDEVAGSGDQVEYYFLNGRVVFYLVAEIFEENDGRAKLDIILQSLEFE